MAKARSQKGGKRKPKKAAKPTRQSSPTKRAKKGPAKAQARSPRKPAATARPRKSAPRKRTTTVKQKTVAKPKHKPLLKSGPPAGFDIFPGQEEAAREIRERLTDASADLSMEAARVRVHENMDGSVDGEMAVKVPRGTSASDLITLIEESFNYKGFSPGIWISVGERFVIKEDDEVYRRNKGMHDASTYYRRAKRSKLADAFLMAREKITAGMEHKLGRKADTVYVRLHWNPDNARPKR